MCNVGRAASSDIKIVTTLFEYATIPSDTHSKILLFDSSSYWTLSTYYSVLSARNVIRIYPSLMAISRVHPELSNLLCLNVVMLRTDSMLLAACMQIHMFPLKTCLPQTPDRLLSLYCHRSRLYSSANLSPAMRPMQYATAWV